MRHSYACAESWAFPSAGRCRVLKQPRTTQRYMPKPAPDERVLTERIIELAGAYGRYGYRRVTALLPMEGWLVNPKRVQRDLATRGAEGAEETAETSSTVAE